MQGLPLHLAEAVCSTKEQQAKAVGRGSWHACACSIIYSSGGIWGEAFGAAADSGDEWVLLMWMLVWPTQVVRLWLTDQADSDLVAETTGTLYI